MTPLTLGTLLLLSLNLLRTSIDPSAGWIAVIVLAAYFFGSLHARLAGLVPEKQRPRTLMTLTVVLAGAAAVMALFCLSRAPGRVDGGPVLAAFTWLIALVGCLVSGSRMRK